MTLAGCLLNQFQVGSTDSWWFYTQEASSSPCRKCLPSTEPSLMLDRHARSTNLSLHLMKSQGFPNKSQTFQANHIHNKASKKNAEYITEERSVVSELQLEPVIQCFFLINREPLRLTSMEHSKLWTLQKAVKLRNHHEINTVPLNLERLFLLNSCLLFR